jgi:hypothetical protein
MMIEERLIDIMSSSWLERWLVLLLYLGACTRMQHQLFRLGRQFPKIACCPVVCVPSDCIAYGLFYSL